MFAKQLAGRAKLSNPSAAPAANAPVRTNVARKNNSGGGPAGPKNSANPQTGATIARASQPPKVADKDDHSDADEGNMVTCVNRGLLQQMLQGMKENDTPMETGSDFDADRDRDSDMDGDEQFSMSLRLRPGTPSALTHGSVPTITSPVSKRMPKASLHTVSGTAAPPAPAPKVSAVAAVLPPPARATGSSVKQAVATGPPQIASTVASGIRPGSRGFDGGGAPPRVITPMNRKNSNAGTPQSDSQHRNANRAAGYAGMYAARNKAPASPCIKSPLAKTVTKPRCGPQAFDMLRQMNTQTSEQASVHGASPGAFPGQGNQSKENDGDRFVMPGDSDDEEEDFAGDRPPVVSMQSKSRRVEERNGSGSVGSQGVASGGTSVVINERAEEIQESAADYVERLKRGISAQSPNVPSAQPPLVEARQARALSSEPRATAPLQGKSMSPAALRANSSEPRASVGRAPPARANHDSDDDSDSDGEGPSAFGQGGAPWKSSIRQMVKEFAHEERSRERSSGGEGASRDPNPRRRPPKAPGAVDALSEDRRRVPADAEVEQESGDHSDPLQCKKPRVVDYTPATLEDYKNKFANKDYSKLRSLGPDLDDEDLLMKKAKQMRQKQYCEEVQRINRQKSTITAATPSKPEPKPEPKPSARAQALEFAKKVPKPKPKPRPKPQEAKQQDESMEAPKRSSDEDVERADLEEIERREQQHFEDVALVKQIKEFLASTGGG